MNSNSKRLIFGTLIFSFFIYTFVIYTSGTSEDKGYRYINEQSKKGKILYQKYNCVACHQLYGLGGYMGPDLTNVISETNKGPMYARAFIQNGTQRMPNFNLKENEIDELISYLTYVDKTGISPVKKFVINYDGTIEQGERNEKGN